MLGQDCITNQPQVFVVVVYCCCCLFQHVAALIESSRTILQVPIQLPKYFFNSSQLTSVKVRRRRMMREGGHIDFEKALFFFLLLYGVLAGAVSYSAYRGGPSQRDSEPQHSPDHASGRSRRTFWTRCVFIFF